MIRRFLLVGLLGLPGASPLTAQGGPSGAPSHSEAYDDLAAERLHVAARGGWERIEREVLSYTAVARRRVAAELRLPLKDRTLYRAEAASRVFWSRDGDAVVQVLGARVWHPGLDEDDEEDAWRGGNVFDPAGDRLSFGLDDGGEVWFQHPLGGNALEHYRFRSGDTLTLSLPDGRRLRAVELQVLPRAADFRRISGSLWIEPETGALVRAVYRLSREIDVIEVAREDGDEDLRYLPGLFRPFTFDVTLVAVDYALWDFRVWLPRSMRAEGLMRAGVVKMPAAVDVSYRMESVVTEADVLAGPSEAGAKPLEERHFRTRSEALAYLAELAGDAGVAYESDELTTRRSGRRIRYLVPEDRSVLAESAELPPPIWQDAAGFPTTGELRELAGVLAGLPAPAPDGLRWTFAWGPGRPDLLRYNRVEGLAVGARLQLLAGSPIGPLSLGLTSFMGTGDLEPKARLSAEHETLRRKLSLGLYREIQSVGTGARTLGPGNSAAALLFGRDDGEYFRATGADVRVTPPSARRASWEVRLHAERHQALETGTDFALFRAFDGDWSFRPNVEATRLDEVGASVLVSPWWGTDPLAPQAGVELYVQGGAGTLDYARASLTLRGAVPLFGGGLRAAAEVAAGESWGDLPLQRHWFLGGSRTLRGYDPSTRVGPSFVRGRVEVARVFPAVTVAIFGDGAWAGDGLGNLREGDALFSLGAGLSLLDGVIRLDVARGLRDPRRLRWDLYLDGIL